MKNIKLIFALTAVLFLSACLKTRSEVGGNYQSQVYSKKQAENQRHQNQEPTEVATVDEKDELIRTLNGRVESLENQIAIIQKEKQENPDGQKIQLLQESLVKMEAQIAKLESDVAGAKAVAQVTPTQAGVAAKGGAKTSFDVAQDYFSKKDFKNAILEYQKFVDSKSKSKHVPEAKYKIGLSFESMGLKDEAQSFYEEVAAQHGGTEFGKKAKQKIAKLKK